jgi:hypothetical protein
MEYRIISSKFLHRMLHGNLFSLFTHQQHFSYTNLITENSSVGDLLGETKIICNYYTILTPSVTTSVKKPTFYQKSVVLIGIHQFTLMTKKIQLLNRIDSQCRLTTLSEIGTLISVLGQ